MVDDGLAAVAVSVEKKLFLRKSTGDEQFAAEADLRDLFLQGQCKASDFVFDYPSGKWSRLGEHPSMASFFSDKPTQVPDRRVIYVLSPGASAGAAPLGPFSTKEIQQRAQLGELCSSSWVFVEGDKEWRQIRSVKILNDMLPALPTDAPVAPATLPPADVAPMAMAPAVEDLTPTGFSLSSPAEAPLIKESPSIPSIKLDLTDPPSGTANELRDSNPPELSLDDDSHVEREEATMALDIMGLKLHSENATPPPAPPQARKPGLAPIPSSSMPPKAPASVPPVAPPASAPSLSIQSNPSIPKPNLKEADAFDGVIAEISTDPIWLVKPANSEAVSGPFRFLEVVKFLEQGKLTKNDKIARAGSKAFVKILQQYEFNVKFSLETVMENGQERQKILIRRRHPRVPYITGLQLVSKYGLLAGQCVNISAGGILMEIPKAEFNLGEIIELKILPGLIPKAISCKALIIGKIPKMPPGYALKFEDLKTEDKEVIEHYVQETLKREMSKKN